MRACTQRGQFAAGRTPVLLSVVAMMLVSALLGFYRLGAKSIWMDEGSTWDFAHDWTTLLAVLPQEANMWLYYGLIHFWMRLFGDSECAMRSFSVLAAVGAVPAVYWVARRLFGVFAGLTAALLLAVNPFFLTFSQQARGYSLLVLLLTVSTGLLLRAVERKRLSGWAWYTLIAALAVYVHYFAVLVILAHGLYLLTLPAAERPFSALFFSAGLGLVLLAPIPLFQPLGSAQVDWIAKPGIGDLFLVFKRFSGGPIGLAASLAVAALGAGWAIMTRGKPQVAGGTGRAWVLVAGWLLVPMLSAFLFSCFVKPVWATRYMVIALPAFAILLGGAVARLRTRPGFAILVLSGLTAAQAAGIPNVYQEETQAWNSAVSWISGRSLPGDGVWFTPGKLCSAYACLAAIRFPSAPPVVKPRNGKEAINPAERYARLNEKSARQVGKRYQRIWIVAMPHGGRERWFGLTETIQAFEPYYPGREKRDFFGLRVVLLSGADSAP